MLPSARGRAFATNGMAADAKQQMRDRFAVEPIAMEPRVFYRNTDSWLELAVRFVTGPIMSAASGTR